MKEYTLLWFIENYSHSWHKIGCPLSSPAFILDGLENTSWLLWLYPRGTKVESQRISVNFGRKESSWGPEDILLKFEISFLAKDGSILKSHENKFSFQEGTSYGYMDFVDIEEVLVRRNAEYLSQDTLNVRCKIWYDNGIIHTVGRYSARTRIGIKKFSFLHKVENFSALKPDEKNTFLIQSLSNPECTFSSTVYFTDIWFHEGTVIIEIAHSDENYILIKRRISLIDGSGKLAECSEADNRLDATRKDIQKLPLSLTRKAILNKREKYLPNNELSVLCECIFSAGVELEKIEEIQYDIPILATIEQRFNMATNENNYNIPEKLLACPSALDDLKTIYSNRSLTDVQLKTKTKSFPTHKLILCARSSVFGAMLSSDMKEKYSDCIEVDDLDDDTVHQLLVFLYSDNIENLQWESAIKLYYAGDKYEVEKLKLMCSSFLVHNISTSTAGELLLLADTHNDCDLKNFAEDFILEHDEEVFGSEEWEKLIETNPQLVIKTMNLKYKRKKGGK